MTDYQLTLIMANYGLNMKMNIEILALCLDILNSQSFKV